MSIRIEATYEDGVLKPSGPLPLKEHQRVRVTIDEVAERHVSRVRATAGLVGSRMTAEEIERVALDPEYSIHESP